MGASAAALAVCVEQGAVGLFHADLLSQELARQASRRFGSTAMAAGNGNGTAPPRRTAGPGQLPAAVSRPRPPHSERAPGAVPHDGRAGRGRDRHHARWCRSPRCAHTSARSCASSTSIRNWRRSPSPSAPSPTRPRWNEYGHPCDRSRSGWLQCPAMTPMKWLAAVLGVLGLLALVGGILYFTIPAHSLPSFLGPLHPGERPSQAPGRGRHRHRRRAVGDRRHRRLRRAAPAVRRLQGGRRRSGGSGCRRLPGVLERHAERFGFRNSLRSP